MRTRLVMAAAVWLLSTPSYAADHSDGPAATASPAADITDVFRDVFDDETLVIDPLTTAKDIDGWDSLTHVRLMLSIERKLKIRISSQEMGSLKTARCLAGDTSQSSTAPGRIPPGISSLTASVLPSGL